MDILSFISKIVDIGQLQVLGYLIGANFVLGTVAALVKGKFEIARLKDFWKRVGTVFGAYITVAVLAKGIADWAIMVPVIYWTLVAYMGAQLVSNLKDCGLPIPPPLQKFIER